MYAIKERCGLLPAICAAQGQRFYGAPAQAWYVLEYSSLDLVGMPIQHNVGVEGLTLVANRLAEISNLSTRRQQGVIRNPGIQIRIRDGLDHLMGEHAVRCIRQCTIGIGRSSGASPYVLVRFHTEYNVTDIREIDKAVVGAEERCRGMVRRIANLVSRKARVDPRRQEYVIFVC